MGLGAALVIPEDVAKAAQKDGYTLVWTYNGAAITSETVVVDGMVVIAQYTEIETPIVYSNDMIVAVKYVDGKIYYSITALDGYVIPQGTIDVSYSYVNSSGDTRTKNVPAEVVSNGMFAVVGDVAISASLVSITASFQYEIDGTVASVESATLFL